MKYFIYCAVLLTAIIWLSSTTQAQQVSSVSDAPITTISGLGVCDGEQAQFAMFNAPLGMATTNDGILIADQGNNRIRKLFNNGTIITIAGVGVAGYNGDNILATRALLNNPTSVAVDSNGEIYITDRNNQRIRKILNNGIIITIAGTGTQGYNGDNIAATTAQLNTPFGIAVAPNGEVYIADAANNRIRKVLTNGMIATIAGSGTYGYNGDNIAATTAQLKSPNGIKLDPISGEVYFSDAENHRIRKILTNGMITTIAGSGTYGYNGDNIAATTAQLSSAYDVLKKEDGEIYITDTANHRVRKILTNGNMITVAGTGSSSFCGEGLLASAVPLSNPKGFFVSVDNEVYIADTGNNRIRKMFNNGTIITIAGTGIAGYNGDNILATTAKLNSPYSVTVNYKEIYIADTGNNRIRKILTNGMITTVAGTGTAGYNGDNIYATTAQLKSPNDVKVEAFTNEVLIADTNNNRIRKILNNGTIITIAGTGTAGYNGDNILATTAQLKYPSAIHIIKDEIYIADTNNHRIRKITDDDMITTVAGTGTSGYNGDNIAATTAKLNYPSVVASSAIGEVFFTDTFNHRIRKLLNNGTIITIAGTGTSGYNGDNIAATSAQLTSPFGVETKLNGEILVTTGNYLRLISPCGGVNNCNGHGVCGGTGTCTCDSGWQGSADCSKPSCDYRNNCSGHGICSGPNTCLCESGWKSEDSADCSKPSCEEVNDCNGSNGDCIGANQCQCKAGYKGPSCSEYSCSELGECSGNGVCTNLNFCTCNSGWQGNDNCSAPSCDAKFECHFKGVCTGPNECTCNSGWKGNDECSVASCESLGDCNNHGDCLFPNTCYCESGWRGSKDCSLPSCDGVSNCTGQGTCIGANQCNCNSGWKGDECSQPSCDALNNCTGNGVCTSSNTCTCNSGWKGNAQCSQYSCEAVNNCVGNGNCIGPNICSGSSSATCQTGWKANTFGAPKPTITTSYNSDSKKFILNIEMFKNDLPDQNTFNSLALATNNLDNSNCQTSDSNNSPFSVISDGKCSKKYEYQFDTSELGSSNNFVGIISPDGNSLIYSSYITTSYSSNDVNTNICSLYQFTTKVQYQLSLVASQTEFTSVDNIGKFVVKRLYINSDKKFVLEGRLSRVFDKVSSFQDITLTKQNAPALTLSQSSSITCGSACYNLIFTSDQIVSESLDDTYKLQFKMSELPSDSNIPIENTRTLSIDIAIQYTVPVDPSVISGSEITSSITLYNSNDALSRPLISYSTNDKVFLGNAINDVNIVLPTNTKFSPLNAKVCCVPSATAFPSTGCSGNGHSSFADLVVNKVVQQNVDVAVEGQDLNSKTANSKEYYLQFLIKDKLSNIPTSAQTCRIYIESTFQTLNSRNVERNELFSTIVKSQSQFSIVDDTTTEREEMMIGTLITNNYYSIIASSVIVGSGLLLSLVIAILAIVYVYFQKKKNAVNNITDHSVGV